MDQNNYNGFNNQNNNDYTNQYDQYNQPQQNEPYQQYAQPQQNVQQTYEQPQYAQPQQYQQYTQPQQYSEPYYNQQYPTYVETNNGRKGMGIASMILGIVSVVLCCLWYITPITSVIGLILGIISLKREDAAKGMAITGIVLSSIGILIAAYIIFCIVIAYSNSDLYNQIYYDLYSDLY